MGTIPYFTGLLLIGFFLQSTNSRAQCSVSPPTGTDGCRYGTGIITLSGAGSTGSYYWFNDTTSNIPISIGATLTTAVLDSSKTYYVAASDTGIGITLDGTNDYAAINTLTYSGTGYQELTVEAWIKTSLESDQVIASFDRSEFWRLEINGSGAGLGQVGFDLNTNAGTLDFGSNSRVDDGKWHHVAGVFDHGTVRIYIDGMLDATTSMGTTFGKASVTRYGFIGVGSEASAYNGSVGPEDYFNGQIDDLRIWNIARSSAEIANNQLTCFTGTEPGLDALYKMNVGMGPTLTDASSTGATATFFNADLMNVWAQDGVGVCACLSAYVPVLANVGQNNLTDLKFTCAEPSFTLDAGAGYSTYTWNTGANTQTIQAQSSGIYTVSVTGGACGGSDTMSITGKRDADRLLQFDGTNDYVAISNYRYTESETEFTVETWLRTANEGDQILISYDRSEYWRLEINGDGGGPGQIGFDILTDAGIVDLGSNARVDDGEWHHVAGVFDNGQISIYIDGTLDVQTNSGSRFGSGITRYGFLGTGSEAPTFNGTKGPNRYFDGLMDETRVWSVARTEAQIRSSMATHVAGNTPGLESCFKFDDPPGARVFDYSTSRSNTGTLYNFAQLDRPPSGAPIGDQSVVLYTNSWSGQTVSVSSCEGEILTVSNMSGSPDGVHVYFVNRPPDSTAGINGLGPNDRYFGVHKIGDDTATYTATYSFMGNPYINSLPKQDLRLFTRTDNAVSTWGTSAATPDTNANSFAATAQFTEFILGSVTSSTLPIELLAFEAKPKDDSYVQLKWVTGTEINNDFFTIERSVDGANWENVSQVAGAGNSSQELRYETIDEDPHKGLSYYRLKQTDYDGQFSYSPVRAIRLGKSGETELVAFPNPTNGLLTIQTASAALGSIRMFSSLGIDVTNSIGLQRQGENQVIANLEHLLPGIYLLKAGSATLRVQKQ